MSLDQLGKVLADAGFDADQQGRLTDIFLWYGVFGVEREDGACAYIYDVNYDVKRLKILISRLERDAPRLVINPAFWAGLEIRTH
jgi:hypothetical protein